MIINLTQRTRRTQRIYKILASIFALINSFAIVACATISLPDKDIKPINVHIEFVWIPAGTFTMGGDHPYDRGARPSHQVTLTQGFYIGKFQVTQEQWAAVMTGNTNNINAAPSSFSSNPAQGEIQANRPVEVVSWYDVIVFCNRLSMARGLSPAYRINGSTNPDDWGPVPRVWNEALRTTWDAVEIVAGANGYRLPLEAQWEFAARAGTASAWSFGDSPSGDYMWYSGNSNGKTREVGLKRPNAWGLYDKHGNVWEWVWDRYAAYTAKAKIDPAGAASGSFRVIRGGGWNDPAEFTSSAVRRSFNPIVRNRLIGFRVVRPQRIVE